jgi:nucleotide-binding universal stress UspA family protein
MLWRLIMFEHILLPVDGSDVSLRAVDSGIALAARLGARVFAFHVASPFPASAYAAEALLVPEDVFIEEGVANAQRCLAEVQRRASVAGVLCDAGFEFDHHPYKAIILAAKKQQCDLIVMGSHSWRGLDRLLLGSETHKVILHSELPVLVCH